jgi:hypothetical protein
VRLRNTTVSNGRAVAKEPSGKHDRGHEPTDQGAHVDGFLKARLSGAERVTEPKLRAKFALGV